MAKSCLYSPLAKDKKPYKALTQYKQELGTSTGIRAFLKALSPTFQERHEGKLDIDSQGVATLESAIKTPDMKKLIGFENIRKKLEKDYGFSVVPNNADNFRMLVNQAKTFNDQNKDYIAYVQVVNGGIRNTIHQKNADTVQVFNNQYGSMILNDRLIQMFQPLGLKIGDLVRAEGSPSGMVNFANAKGIAGEFVNLIMVSNDMQGQTSMSEEFAHLIVRMLKNQPLIQRMLNGLSQSVGQMQQILGNDFDSYAQKAMDKDGNIDYQSIAEECLGRLLQQNMLNVVQQQEASEGYIQRMWRRAYEFIKKLFRNFNHMDVQQAVIDADQTLDDLAKNLLGGKIEFNRQDIMNTFSSDRMYHLEKNVEYLQKILEDAITTETKKTRIIKSEKAIDKAQKRIDNLNAILDGTPEGKLKGIINYAQSAIYDFGSARLALQNYDITKNDFAKLRGIRSTIQSYNDFIEQITDLINSQDKELEKLISDTSIENKEHVLVTLRDTFTELNRLSTLVRNNFKDIALGAVEEFFKPFFSVTDGTFIDKQGKERNLKQLIEEANGDIGFVDRYLMTMSSSGDLLLQLFNAVVGKAKADARYNTIDDLQEITRLMLDANEMGIRDFEWMFEKDRDGHKTGNYISAVNTGQYEKDKQEFLEQLEQEYGINPSGEKAKEKRNKRKAWFETHGKMKGFKANPTMYSNPEFDKLTPNQRVILDRYMQIKQRYDKRIPSNKTSISRAIQMRRTSQQRFMDSASDPTKIFENMKESIAKDFTKTTDDDSIYGEKTGLRSFDGSEFMVLPALYTTKLSNPDELSTDVFSALAAYSYSTNTYQELDKVVDPLEVAKAWVNENRKVRSTSNGKQMVEKMKGKNPVIKAIFETTGSNIEKKLQDFMEAQVYSRYYADSDQTINVMGREIKAGKLVNKGLSISSTVQLGFNILSNMGNLATGLAMQNIEALSGHYFGAKELLMADNEYRKQLIPFMTQVQSKNPTNKLALFDQLFDIKQEFGTEVKNRMNRIFEKVFGKSIAFLGQTCGDHWLYNRTAIAMCLRKKVRLSNGTVTSLWEALQVENAFQGDNRIKKLVINAVDAETGQKIDRDYIREYSAQINEINHRLFGVYNTDDMVAAQRVALGRCTLQYRQWMIPMFARRFQSRQYNLILKEYEEGYYRTAFTLLQGLKGGMTGLAEVWNEFDEPQKRNVYRALIEFVQFMCVWAIANFVNFGNDDPDRSQAMKLAEYMAQRELHELGNLTPSFTMGNEILKTIKSPATILNTTQSALNLLASLLDPRDWNDEIESGKYEGMSTLHKNILKAPFPILAPFNQLARATENIEEVTRYYARSY